MLGIRRRNFIRLLGGAAAWPMAARAQQAMPVIGYLFPGLPEETGFERAFREGLNGHGFIEGRNVSIEWRFARNNNQDKLRELAADLVQRRVSVIAAVGGTAGVLAAKAATATIPIVFEIGTDPVQEGLVASFNKPGGNITGTAALNHELDGKRLALLTEFVPGARRIGVLISTPLTMSLTQARIRNIETAAAALGRQTEVFRPTNSREIDEVFASLMERQIGALFVSASAIYSSFRAQIATAAARHGIPTLTASREMARAGALASYGSEPADNFRMVGTYVARILKGERPADLPVIQPTKFDLVINLQTARTLRLEISATLLARADEVIE
jgi:putative ABC transport system substrate-binding protein